MADALFDRLLVNEGLQVIVDKLGGVGRMRIVSGTGIGASSKPTKKKKGYFNTNYYQKKKKTFIKGCHSSIFNQTLNNAWVIFLFFSGV